VKFVRVSILIRIPIEAGQLPKDTISYFLARLCLDGKFDAGYWCTKKSNFLSLISWRDSALMGNWMLDIGAQKKVTFYLLFPGEILP
jgi:hypothetical protein